mmetsp:Transcript_89173/g.123848  ORF Transcript_89173/g.123848 Transcript_89173/m.123848 type:complete len:131 (+) Transcript_89173:428-820(+)
MTWDFIDNLFITILGEFDSKTMAMLTYCMREVVLAGENCLSEQELQEVFDNIVRGIKESDERKAHNMEVKDDPDCDDEDIRVAKEDNDMEDEYCCALAEFSGALFQTHKEMALPLAETLYKQILPKVLSE